MAGWLVDMNGEHALVGSRFDSSGFNGFIVDQPLPDVLSVYKGGQHVDRSHLQAGQRVTFYEAALVLMLKKSILDAQIDNVLGGDRYELSLLLIDNKPISQFNIEHQPFYTSSQSSWALEDKVRWVDYVTRLEHSAGNTYLEEDDKLSIDAMRLDIAFDRNTAKTAFYEISAQPNNHRLYFVSMLESARIEATLKPSAVLTDISINEIEIKSDAELTLSYYEEDIQYQKTFSDFETYIKAVANLTNSYLQKFVSLKAQGNYLENQFIVSQLHLFLNTPLLLGDENARQHNADIVSRIDALTEADKAEIKNHKTKIAAIAGGVSAGIAGAVLLHYLRHKIKSFTYEWGTKSFGVSFELIEYFDGHRFSVVGETYRIKNLNSAFGTLPKNIKAKKLLFLGNNLVNTDTHELIPYRWDETSKKWIDRESTQWRVVYDQEQVQKAAKPLFRWSYIEADDLNSYDLGFKEPSLTIERSDELYRFKLPGGTYIYSNIKADGTLHAEIINEINFLVEAVPAEKRLPFYWGPAEYKVFFGHFEGAIKKKKTDTLSRFYRFLGVDSAAFRYRFRQSDFHRPELQFVEKEGPFKGWSYTPDEALHRMRKANDGYIDKPFNDELGDERLNPDNLKVLVQLEDDPAVMNTNIYQTYLRHPDHSILVQMNKEGNFRIVNGVENLDKFVDPAFKDKVVFQPVGHGWFLSHGEHNSTQLANNMNNLLDKLPQEAQSLYKAKTNQNLSFDKSHFIPNHMNMDGCLLGRSTWYSNAFMKKFGDKFYKVSGLNPTIEGFSRVTTVTTTGQSVIHPDYIDAETTYKKKPFSVFGSPYSSQEEAYQRAHKVYQAGMGMSAPVATGAEGLYYYDMQGIKRKIFRGKAESPGNL